MLESTQRSRSLLEDEETLASPKNWPNNMYLKKKREATAVLREELVI